MARHCGLELPFAYDSTLEMRFGRIAGLLASKKSVADSYDKPQSGLTRFHQVGSQKVQVPASCPMRAEDVIDSPAEHPAVSVIGGAYCGSPYLRDFLV